MNELINQYADLEEKIIEEFNNSSWGVRLKSAKTRKEVDDIRTSFLNSNGLTKIPRCIQASFFFKLAIVQY